MKESEWKEIGKIFVDAGLCWVGDPCYTVTPDASHHPAKSWDEFCDKLDESPTKNYKQWGEGIGVTVQTGYGDGEYPVYAKFNGDGRIMAVMVDFDDYFDEDE